MNTEQHDCLVEGRYKTLSLDTISVMIVDGLIVEHMTNCGGCKKVQK